MPLAPGVRLGPYEIVGLIGAGGMGEVYRARDTRLDRTVAVKVLPAAFAADPTLRARFEREARAVSALEHPHICTLHDVGEHDGQAYLVMEHLAGETLAERLRKGPLPLEQALEVGAQVAEALAAAHRQGIVHRDLKPGNVMLTKAGAKLLDFGLARLTHHGERPVVESFTSAPTEPAPLTGRGTILGTIPYMAPEQLEGKSADARTDLWALGAILYEMASGRRAFEGTSQVSLIAAIVEHEPTPLATLQPLTPPSLERLVRRCLAKSPDDRWESAHDVADELRWIARSAVAPEPATGGGLLSRSRWRLAVSAFALAAVSLAVGGLAGRLLVPSVARPLVVRSLLDVAPAEELSAGGLPLRTALPTPGGSRTALALAPDGQTLVFIGLRAGVRQLYVRRLDRDEARPLEGTEGAQVLSVSPDGGSIVFWAAGAISRVPLAGGPAEVLVRSVRRMPSGIACAGDGRVYFDGPDGAIWWAAAERAPAALTKKLAAELSHGLPSLLPGDRVLLYTARRRLWSWGDEEVVAHDLGTGGRKVLLRDAADARYLASGHLAFLRQGTLFAAAFDPVRLELLSTPVPVVDRVAQSLSGGEELDLIGAGHFSVARNGDLAFIPGDVTPYPEVAILRVDRRGRARPLRVPARTFSVLLAGSPDGRRLALLMRSLDEQSLWIHDLDRGTLSRLTAGGEADTPVWAPDGRRVAFVSRTAGNIGLVWQRADGGDPEPLFEGDAGYLSSFSPDGRHVALVKDDDIWIGTIEGGRVQLAPPAHTPEVERWPSFSPDGRWLVYASSATGRLEVYVRPFPGPGPQEQVSREGGHNPAWTRGGREIVFIQPVVPGRAFPRQMMAVDIGLGETLTVGTARPLFEAVQSLGWSCVPTRCFAVSPDGEQFFVAQAVWPVPITPPRVTHVRLVLNWTEELEARVTAGPTP